MATMVLRLNGRIRFTYHDKPRVGTVIELRPKHDMVLVQIGEGQFRNFKISKMIDIREA